MSNIVQDDLNQIYIIDSGNFSFKVGSINESKPKLSVQTKAGINEELNKIYFGKDINEVNQTNCINLMKNGDYTNLDLMNKFWHSLLFNELKLTDLNDKPILYTSHINTSKINKEKIISNFFENFNIPYFYLANQSLMNIYSVGKITGVIFNIGGYNTSVCPIFEGTCNLHSFSSDIIGGENLTKNLYEILNQNNEISNENLDSIREIKENFVKVSNDYLNDIKELNLQPNIVTLPDGKTINLGEWAYSLPEKLFDRNSKNITSIFEESLSKVEWEYKSDFYNNIVVTGGCSNFSNFDSRILNEVNKTKPNFYNTKVFNCSDRINSSWIGGSILANLSNYQQMWVSKQEYEENGPTIVHRKCL